MKWFLLSFFILTPVFSATDDDRFHVCFFELDNTKTSQNFKKRMGGLEPSNNNLCKKKQELSGKNIVVHCYQPQVDEDVGSVAFERMIQEIIQSGDRCDGLVMSGHHTGDWYGGTGHIKLKDMERLSCNPKYKNWFSNIKALWLDGCNTVTDNILKSEQTNIPTPDSETARIIGKEYPENSIDRWAIADTSQAYTASLDRNTPLSSRYLRMFPHVQIYGFNGASPEGAEKGSASFIANHLSLIGSALQAEQNQMQKEEGKTVKQAMLTLFSSDLCDPDRLSAWEEAGWEGLQLEAIEQQDYRTAYKLGCQLILAKQVLDNPDSANSQKALAEYIKKLADSENIENKIQLLDLANEILSQPNSDKAVKLAKMLLLNTLDEITEQDSHLTEEDKTYTHLLFNNIYETWKTAQKYQSSDNSFYRSVQKKMQADNFKVSLKERIESHQTASLKKGDYIKFYMEVNNLTLSNLPACIRDSKQPPPCIRQEIQHLAQKAGSLFSNLSSPRQSQLPIASRRALAASVVDQLFQYDLLTDRQVKDFLKNSDLFPKNNENPFLVEVKVNLVISNEVLERRLVEGLQAGTIKRSIRQPVLRALSHKYFQDPAGNLGNLQTIANAVDMDDNADVMTFFNMMHSQFVNQTPKQQEDFILEYSQKSNRNLEELLLWYADTNFTPDRKKEICRRLDQKNIQGRNLGYICKG
ncbi:MAG: hypothetical protein OXN83_04050 [Oligoflexia bacterium]|nr:hypothetical protein [Oligoflexia bacterium]